MRNEPISIVESPLWRVRTCDEIAALLGIDVAEIRRLSKDDNYLVRPQPDKPGKFIREPKRPLKKVLSKLHSHLGVLRTPDYVHSTKGRSYVTNADAHRHGDYLAKMDIKAFFENCDREHVFRFFRYTLEMSDAPAWLLTDLVMHRGNFPRGAPTSSTLSYWAYHQVFDALAAIAADRGLKFTLYLDDMTFSGSAPIGGRFFATVKFIFKKHGLTLNRSKWKKYGKTQPKLVTGCFIVDHDLRIPNAISHGIVKKLSQARQRGRIGKSELDSLTGSVYAARQIEPLAFESTLKLLKAKQQALRKRTPKAATTSRNKSSPHHLL